MALVCVSRTARSYPLLIDGNPSPLSRSGPTNTSLDQPGTMAALNASGDELEKPKTSVSRPSGPVKQGADYFAQPQVP